MITTMINRLDHLGAQITDVRDNEKFPAFVAQVDEITQGAGVNLLINNSGILQGDSTLNDLNKDTLMLHFEVNTVSPILLTKVQYLSQKDLLIMNLILKN